MPLTPERIKELLVALVQQGRLDGLLRALNYELRDLPISTTDWTERQRAPVREVRLAAQADGFNVLHCTVDSLTRTREREIANRLAGDYPYALIIFSDQGQRNWHFVNLLPVDGKPGRVLRRIVVGKAEVSQDHLRTPSERLQSLVATPGVRALQLVRQCHEAFDVEPVTRDFFETYKEIFESLKHTLARQRGRTEKQAHDFAQLLLNRLMFLYFLQKRGWLAGNYTFFKWLRHQYSQSGQRDLLYPEWLRPLFFESFNRKSGFQQSSHLPAPVKKAYATMPYLNGGLFSAQDPDQHDFRVPDEHLEDIFRQLLDRFNFTVAENTPFDQEVAVDPEMLGKVYESLVTEDERHSTGIYYSPRVELDFMCRRALIEHLSHTTTVERPALIYLVMNAETREEIPDLRQAQWQEIQASLQTVRVVDPACGSGAFLVGMMQCLLGVLRLIHEKTGGTPDSFDDFAAKRRTIQDNLFGVDVKDWAVRVAELRLWLSLAVDAPEDWRESQLDPLLPNLTYRLCVGDSLVQEVGGRPLTLRRGKVGFSQRVAKAIRDLQKVKGDHFRGRALSAQDQQTLTHNRRVILEDAIDQRRQQVEAEIRQLERRERGEVRERIAGIASAEEGDDAARLSKRDMARLVALREERAFLAAALREAGTNTDFLWEIDFAEVWGEKKGFDVVIGNPPYASDEEIEPPLVAHAQASTEQARAYRAQLGRAVTSLWGDAWQVSRRADLCVYFYLAALSLLRPGGTLSFVTSQSWLDADYGDLLQSFLLDKMELREVLDNRAKRTFSAEINTVIACVRRPERPSLEGQLVRFIAFDVPYEEGLTADNILAIESVDTPVSTRQWRCVAKTHHELLVDPMSVAGLDSWPPKYQGGKWGRYLRAPDIYWHMLEQHQTHLVALGQVADVTLGSMTLQNEFFHVRVHAPWPARTRVVVCTNAVGHRFEMESCFLVPLLKDPKICDCTVAAPDSITLWLFRCPLERRDLSGTAALRYINWGEKAPAVVKQGSRKGEQVVGYHNLPALRGRSRWWDIGSVPTPSIIMPKGTGDTHKHCVVPFQCTADQRFYCVTARDRVCLLPVFNSTVYLLFKEAEGRVALGGGALDMSTRDVRRLRVPDPRALSSAGLADDRPPGLLRQRRWGRVPDELLQPDRRALDEAVFDVLGLAQAERDAVYEAVIELVEARLKKAESLRSRRRSATESEEEDEEGEEE